MKKSIFLLGSVFALMTSQAFAEKGPRHSFSDLDADGSGFLSVEEITAIHQRRVEKMVANVDSDADGSISLDEWENRPVRGKGKKREAPEFAELDADGNGLVSVLEIADFRSEKIEETFSKMDADGDGAVSEEEWENRPKRQKKQREEA